MENTKIAWATHTMNPWLGCSKKHAGCLNCYAEAIQGRLGVTWGPNGTRRRTAASTWKKVERWNLKAAQNAAADDVIDKVLGEKTASDRPRVFPSLCDVFEQWDGVIGHPSGGRCLVTRSGLIVSSNTNPEYGVNATMADVRRDFFALIDRCPNLDFLLLTKRPENIRRMWRDVFADGHPTFRRNVWLLYSASDQATLEAGLPHLLACRGLAPVLGLSLEPLIGPVDLSRAFYVGYEGGWEWNGAKRMMVDWVIVGGESGPNARPCHVEWIRDVLTQCQTAGVPCWGKQMGSNAYSQGKRLPLLDAKGGDSAEWEPDLCVMELPKRRQ